MTADEAYRWLYVHFAPCGDETKQDEAVNVALKALEKQIPKKPKSVFCPQCGEEFTDDDCWSSDYCRNCGQAIDWEGE